MSDDPVQIVEKSTAFQGHFRIDRYRLRHRLYEGGMSETMTREVFERGHAVSVLLYDADRDVLVLVEQFRIGTFAAMESGQIEGSPWIVECVAGIMEDGETPEDVARRESLEEAGCTVGDVVPICRCFASPGASTETVHLLCGQVDSTGVGGIHGLDHEQEDIRVLVRPVLGVFDDLTNGRILNAMTVVSLEWFRRNHAALRERWRSA